MYDTKLAISAFVQHIPAEANCILQLVLEPPLQVLEHILHQGGARLQHDRSGGRTDSTDAHQFMVTRREHLPAKLSLYASQSLERAIGNPVVKEEDTNDITYIFEF